MSPDGHLTLIYPGGSCASIDGEAPQRLLEKIRSLHAGLRVELNLRAPMVLEQLVDELLGLGEISDHELQLRKSYAQRDVDRYRAEQDRRAAAHETCSACGRHPRDGHAGSCPLVKRQALAAQARDPQSADAAAQGELDLR